MTRKRALNYDGPKYEKVPCTEDEIKDLRLFYLPTARDSKLSDVIIQIIKEVTSSTDQTITGEKIEEIAKTNQFETYSANWLIANQVGPILRRDRSVVLRKIVQGWNGKYKLLKIVRKEA